VWSDVVQPDDEEANTIRMDVSHIPACSLGPLAGGSIHTSVARNKNRRTVSDDRHEVIYWDGPVEDHLG
jgi:hypothetical protein